MEQNFPIRSRSPLMGEWYSTLFFWKSLGSWTKSLQKVNVPTHNIFQKYGLHIPGPGINFTAVWNSHKDLPFNV